MHRRRVLATLSTALLPAAGCVGGPTDSGDGAATTGRSGPDTDTPTPTPSPTSTPTPDTTTEECDWPIMCTGTTLLELFVDVDHDHAVRVGLGCRPSPVTVDPGGYHEVTREADGEECAVTVSADGETLYETVVTGSERVTVRVEENGEVDVETAVL